MACLIPWVFSGSGGAAGLPLAQLVGVAFTVLERVPVRPQNGGSVGLATAVAASSARIRSARS